MRIELGSSRCVFVLVNVCRRSYDTLKRALPWMLAFFAGVIAVSVVLLGLLLLGLAHLGWESPKVWVWLDKQLKKAKICRKRN